MAGPKLEVVISAQIDQLQKGLATAQSNLSAFSAEASTKLQRVGDAIKSVAIPAGIAAAALGAMGLSAVRAYGRLEALEKGLAAVAGSTEAAKSQLNDLREVAKLPGLGLEEAVRGSISLQAIGISADVAKNAILQFGNAVATVGKGRAELDRALYGLQQLANTDFPLGEDLNIIKDAIPQVSRLLDEAFGANRSDALAKMGVTSQQVVDVILKGLADLPRVSGGVENAFENMGDSLTEAWQEVGKAINESLNFEGVLNKLGDTLGGVVTWFRSLSPAARDMIVYIGAGVTAFAALLAALGAIITIAPIVFGSITLMTGGIAAVTAGIAIGAVAIANNLTKVKKYVIDTANAIVTVYYHISKAITDALRSIGLGKLASTDERLNGLSRTMNNLTNKSYILGQQIDFAAQEAEALKNIATVTAPVIDAVGESFGKGAEAAKRLGLEIWKLNGIQALNGKELNRKKFKPAEQIGSLDRGTTIDLGILNITGLITDAQARAQEVAEAFNDSLGQTLNAGVENIFGSLGASIGDALASGGNIMEAAGAGLLSSLGAMLVDLGKMAIGVGVTLEAVKTALKTLNPVAAIAAGVALVAIGTAFSKGAQSLAGGSVGGQGSQTQNYTSGTVVRPAYERDRGGMQTLIRGKDLVTLYDMNAKYKGR